MTGEHSIRQIIIEDSSTLVVCGDLTPILSLQSLEITELLWIDGAALRKLLSGLPNLRILSISSYEILGINEIDETFPSLPLVRLRGSLPTIGSLAPSSISTLQSLCIDLSGADELGDIFEDERPIGIPATLAQYRQLRNLHFTFEPCKWSSVNHFLISVPYKELHLSSFHITMEWSDYYSSFPGTLNKLANLLRWKLPTSCSLILDMPLKSLINLNVLMEGTLDAFLSSVKEIFRTDIRPWALRPEELPLREIRITGNSSMQMEFYCISSGREWCLLVEGTQPKVREELARLGQPQLRHFSLSRDS
ncbi:hypothetical protein FRC18_009735 [Serendipita sp. 400]|nr:hypothetical protein FRC18_009735 [Serendipita sp. 400]